MEEKKKKISERIGQVLKETVRILVIFFKPFEAKHELLKVPEHVKKQGGRLGWFDFILNAIGFAFSYLLVATNWSIEHKLVILGIVLFSFSKARHIVEIGLKMMNQNTRTTFETLFDNEEIEMGHIVLAKVINKVRCYNEETKYWSILTKDEIINSLKTYIESTWNIAMYHRFEIFKMLIAILSIIFAIITNNKINQAAFILIVLLFSVISFITSAACSRNNRQTDRKNRKERNIQSSIISDVMRIPEVVPGDINWRLKKFRESAQTTKANVMKNNTVNNLINISEMILEFICQVLLIIMYVVSVIKEGGQITVATIAEITASLAIVTNALGSISEMGYELTHYASDMNRIIVEEDRVDEILSVYQDEISRENAQKEITEINIKPFQAKYQYLSENDKAFTLVSEKTIHLSKGEIAVLYGPSGAGKSTLINLVTDRISFEKTIEVPQTSRCLIYDETMKFGSFDIFTELFCNKEETEIDISKMKSILESLHLWQELSCNCENTWTWMKEHKFTSLSNGQKQRIILAKMMYFLNPNIDVIVLDEATSGLDERSEDINNADAQKILKFLIEYCNKDKERIIIISTHQDLEGIKKAYDLRNFYFERNGNKSFVSEKTI